jgi:hypothetical protein
MTLLMLATVLLSQSSPASQVGQDYVVLQSVNSESMTLPFAKCMADKISVYSPSAPEMGDRKRASQLAEESALACGYKSSSERLKRAIAERHPDKSVSEVDRLTTVAFGLPIFFAYTKYAELLKALPPHVQTQRKVNESPLPCLADKPGNPCYATEAQTLPPTGNPPQTLRPPTGNPPQIMPASPPRSAADLTEPTEVISCDVRTVTGARHNFTIRSSGRRGYEHPVTHELGSTDETVTVLKDSSKLFRGYSNWLLLGTRFEAHSQDEGATFGPHLRLETERTDFNPEAHVAKIAVAVQANFGFMPLTKAVGFCDVQRTVQEPLNEAETRAYLKL